MRTKYIFAITILSIFAIFVFGKTIVQANNIMTGHSSDRQMYGFAWSSNIGWISFNNCTNPAVPTTTSCSGIDYGVSVDPTNGNVSGYAWSSNIGWISFKASDTASCPSGVCQAKLNVSTGVFSGWAKALSGGDGSSGWNGFIDLSSDAGSSSWGFNANMATGVVNGYAWGGNVVGWISANCTNDSSCSTANCTNDSSCSTANCTNDSSCSTADYSVKIMSATSTLTATDCVIPTGSSSCPTNITWNTTNPVGTYSVTSNDCEKMNGSSGSGSCLISYPSETFYLSNYIGGNTISVAEVQANATCQAGSVWNGTICSSSAPYVSLIADPLNVANKGDTSNLSWTSNLSDITGSLYSCSVTAPWKNPGSRLVQSASPEATNAINSPTTFAITCTDSLGGKPTVTSSVIVGIGATPITVTLSASPSTLSSAGGSSTLTWKTTGDPTSCTASGGWGGPRAISNTVGEQVSPTSTTDYKLDCSNVSETGSATATVTVSVDVSYCIANPTDPLCKGICFNNANSLCVTYCTANPTSPICIKKPIKPIYNEF